MLLNVSDIKQFCYCPRIPYYRYVMPVPHIETPNMLSGRAVHLAMPRTERRRTLRRYQLRDGERLFNQVFVSERLGLMGKLDLLIRDGTLYFPVEYKDSVGEPGLHHRYQLAAYALLVEDSLNTVVRTGYVYMLGGDEVFQYEISESKKRHVKQMVARIGKLIEMEAIPNPTPHRDRCSNCEFRLYCADIA